MADPAVAVLRTLARRPPDALGVVASRFGRGADAEVCRMRLPIGLGGGACSVLVRRGMMMTELRQEVSRVLGWPADEQLYVRADTTQLLDDDGEVPAGLPPRCLRAAGHARDGSSSPASEPSLSEELSGSEPAESGAAAGAARAPRAQWADLAEEEEEACPAPPPRAPAPASGGARAESWAWQFMLRWRRWAPRERQHQFYVAIRDERYLQEHRISRSIRQSCGCIYKEGQVMVRLRGRGSGFLEVKWKGQKWESSDPLMVCLSGRVPYDLDTYWFAFYEIARLLEEDVYAAYNREQRHALEVHLGDEWVHSGRRLGGRRCGQAAGAWW